MNRYEATAALLEMVTDEPIVASLGHASYDLFAAGDRPLNFYTWGSMGVTSSIAFGLALARPDRRVIALDGDGSLLMNLGGLATIGQHRPPNLVVVVWDNEQYATTGGQPTPTAERADLAAAARALGIDHAETVRTIAELRAALDDRSDGPFVILAKVDESRPTMKPPLDCVYLKQRFMAALGNAETATAGSNL